MNTVFFIIVATLSFALGIWVGRRNKSEAPLFTEDELEADDRLFSARKAVGERIQKRLDRIMIKAEVEGRITNDGVEDLFCISDRTASRYLNRLEELNKVQQKGVGRGTYYVPTK